ncbi:MAG TPA: STAS domain-containing protein [Actinomycetota bacterium]|nr:STAS domain-containing protein [Actinomycetota bacterium]
MDVTTERTAPGEPIIVRVSGEVDVLTASALQDALAVAAAEGPQVVVDLRGVDFLDSTGLSALVFGLKRARERGGDLSVVCQHRQILKVLDITGLSRILQVYADLAEATGALPPTQAAG